MRIPKKMLKLAQMASRYHNIISVIVKKCFHKKRSYITYIELCKDYYTHRVISDKVHRLLVTLSYFRPARFVQLLSLIPILILLLYLLVSIDLVYTGLRELVP